jgi:magnesium transporter
VLTVVFLPLTLIASIFGMNTGVPGERSLNAFYVIIGVMVVMLVAMLAFFRRRGWL